MLNNCARCVFVNASRFKSAEDELCHLSFKHFTTQLQIQWHKFGVLFVWMFLAGLGVKGPLGRSAFLSTEPLFAG